ncbi:MAG: hypothetical protein E6J45_12015 [Chloroflexi bacterium]|nr:MAG: hypothetical protein E6J45_12015 [Chloroflexota bacterium]
MVEISQQRWMAMRDQRRLRWRVTIGPAAAALLIAALWRHDSSPLLLSVAAFSIGALLAVVELTALAHRYGGFDPAAVHTGEELEIAVSRPDVRSCLLPIGVALFVAVAFLVAAHANPAPGKPIFALIVFSMVCSWAVGFDTAGTALTGRWERAIGLRIYRPQCRTYWRRVPSVHVAVPHGSPAAAGRLPLPLLLATAAAFTLLVSAADVHEVWQREAPWTAALPTVRGEAAASHIDPALGSVASKLVGRTVEVRCWSRSDWARIRRARGDSAIGFAEMRGSRIDLAPLVCRPLMALEYHHDQPLLGSERAWSLSFAVVALGHEAGHLALGRDESRAECFGLRSADRTATMLGADATYAWQLQSTYRRLIYPRRDAIYRAGGCPV